MLASLSTNIPAAASVTLFAVTFIDCTNASPKIHIVPVAVGVARPATTTESSNCDRVAATRQNVPVLHAEHMVAQVARTESKWQLAKTAPPFPALHFKKVHPSM
jgi:hypothetical protein